MFLLCMMHFTLASEGDLIGLHPFARGGLCRRHSHRGTPMPVWCRADTKLPGNVSRFWALLVINQLDVLRVFLKIKVVRRHHWNETVCHVNVFQAILHLNRLTSRLHQNRRPTKMETWEEVRKFKIENRLGHLYCKINCQTRIKNSGKTLDRMVSPMSTFIYFAFPSCHQANKKCDVAVPCDLARPWWKCVCVAPCQRACVNAECCW